MKITKEIREAISRAVEANGSQSALARITGISSQNICRYLNGVITEIKPKSMSKLLPEIKHFLPEGFDFPIIEKPAVSDLPSGDAELEILKRDAKIAQLVLQVAYLERKIKRLRELNGFERDIKN